MLSTQVAPVRLVHLVLRNYRLMIALVVALSANTSDAQIMTRVGSEWKTISTLTEVCGPIAIHLVCF